jgi:multiple sugar transport system substrate-binding protein
VFLAAALVAAALVAFVGCKGKSSGKIELNFMEVMTSPARTEVLKGIIAQFEAAHPNITVNLISPPYEQADNRLTMGLNAEEPLDIIEVRDLTASQHVNNKKLTDLTDYIAKWDEGDTLIALAVEAASAAGGRPYHLPQFFYIKALFVRTDILAKYGITKLPDTLDELYAISKQITNPAQNQFGFTLRGKGDPYKTSDVLILADLNDVDTENFYMRKDGSTVYESPDYIDALTRYVGLYKDATPSDSINWGFNEQINAFVSGITPFLLQDPDAVPLIDEQLGRDKYTVIPVPAGRSGTIYLDYGTGGFGITSYSKHKQEAWEFIAFISSTKQNSEFAKKYGALPVHITSFTDDPYFNSGVYQAWATTMNTPGRFTFIKYPYFSPKFPSWGQVHEQYMQSTLMGNSTPEEAAKAWITYWK